MNVCMIDTSDGGLYRDEACTDPLPRHIGPFGSERAAQRYLDGMGPLWGSYSITPLSFPGSTERKHTNRSADA